MTVADEGEIELRGEVVVKDAQAGGGVIGILPSGQLGQKVGV